MRRSHAPCSNPCSVGGWRSVSLTISISSGPSTALAPGGFLSDMLSSPRVHPPKPLPHGRVRPHQQISYPAYARVDLPLVACGCPLPSPMGRQQSSSEGSVCLYQAGNHCPLAGYRTCSIRVSLRSSCVFVIGGSIKTFRFGQA